MHWPAAVLLLAASIVEPVALDPLVVTGSREPQAASAAPFSISTIDRDALEDAGPGISLAEALVRVPGVASSSRSNYAQDVQLSVRGFGARAGFGVRGVRLYTDGIPASAPDGQGQLTHFNLGSANRIEVLRGPYSALYGSSSGGVIALHSAAPAGDFAEVATQAGAFGERQQRVHAGVRRDALAGAGEWSRFDIEGFRPHSAARRTLGFARGQWDSDRDRIVLLASHWDQPAQDPLGLTRAQFVADPRQTAPQAIAFDARKDARQSQAGAQWRHALVPGASLDLGAWGGTRDVTQWLAIPAAAQADPRHAGGVVELARDTVGAELRGSIATDGFVVIAGLTGERQDETRRGYENFDGAQLGVTGALRRDEDNLLSAFDQYLQLQWDAGRLSGGAGVRSGAVRVHSADRYVSNGDDSGSRQFHFVNPAVGLRWEVRPTLGIYASAGRGYETPTLNELAYRADGSAGLNAGLRPQVSHQFELGAKWRGAGQRADLALFQADVDSELTPRSNSGGRATFQNGGASRRQGVELEWRGEFAEWHALGAATYIDARYREGFSTCGPPPCLTPDVPVAPGNRLPAVPRESAYAELSRRFRGIELAAEWRAAGRRAVNDANAEFAAGYGVVGLRAAHRWEFSPLALKLSLRGDNLLDRAYAPSVIVNEGNARYYEPGAPRSWLATVAVEWGQKK
ncbi:MAG TPA: TonB-dependent receptor [Verrucomicrobiae bacterium]|nr:TonB-dependent receptor [Verrucomicrobiae bacterium]